MTIPTLLPVYNMQQTNDEDVRLCISRHQMEYNLFLVEPTTDKQIPTLALPLTSQLCTFGLV